MATVLQLANHKEALDSREREIERLHTLVFDLRSCLGGCTALMRADIEGGKINPSETRLCLLARARELDP